MQKAIQINRDSGGRRGWDDTGGGILGKDEANEVYLYKYIYIYLEIKKK